MASLSKSSRRGDNGVLDYKDRISNLPMVLIDKILGHLTIFEKAKCSVLSKQWRHKWSCVNSIVIDRNFWEKQRNEDRKLDLKKGSIIISSILLCHNGPIHEFSLAVPKYDFGCQETLNLSPWLCFLSKNGVKNITLTNLNYHRLTLPSTIYSCIELVELKLDYFILNPPPLEFEQFQHLSKLYLTLMKSNELICNHLLINAPNLKTLSVIGKLGSLCFRKVPKLVELVVCLTDRGMNNSLSTNVVDTFINLATLSALEILQVDCSLCKMLFAGGILNLYPLAFTNLNELYLENMELDDFGSYSLTCALIQSCPSIKKLAIWVSRNKKNMDVEHNCTFDNKDKLEHLQIVEIEGLTGSQSELKLIEHLLQASNALISLYILLGELDDSSELKLQRELNGFQRASPKARIVFLKKSVLWVVP